jgi:hypothetical protein
VHRSGIALTFMHLFNFDQFNNGHRAIRELCSATKGDLLTWPEGPLP